MGDLEWPGGLEWQGGLERERLGDQLERPGDLKWPLKTWNGWVKLEWQGA